MITRKDYLDGKATHREYYAQFVTEQIRDLVRHGVGIERIKKSTDKHFNDIPLHIWDCLASNNRYALAISKSENGQKDFSLGSSVCILKEAARQIKEN